MSNENAVALITGDINSARDAFEACLVDRSLRFDAEAGFAIQILSNSDYALKVARQNRQSVIDAVTNVAAIGLSLNPAKKHAYLVPRKVGGYTRIVLDISYMGMIELAVSSGSVSWAQARTVHANDSFKDNGPGMKPEHSYSPFGDRGDIVGVYAVAKLPCGDYLTEIMSVVDVNDIRDRSEAWKSFSAGDIKSCPWSTDWAEMAKKTVIKRASKYWPKTERLDQATHHLNTDGGEGLVDLAENAAAPRVSGFEVGEWIERVRSAKTLDELGRLYTSGIGEAAKVRDGDGARKFKEAALARRAQLQAANTVDMEG